MFGFRFMKASPTTYVLHYIRGHVRREGAGHSPICAAIHHFSTSIPIAPASTSAICFVRTSIPAR